jgi:hypothetical protein
MLHLFIRIENLNYIINQNNLQTIIFDILHSHLICMICFNLYYISINMTL